MMESVLCFIIIKFILWIFPSRKIEDVSVADTKCFARACRSQITINRLTEFCKSTYGDRVLWVGFIFDVSHLNPTGKPIRQVLSAHNEPIEIIGLPAAEKSSIRQTSERLVRATVLRVNLSAENS